MILYRLRCGKGHEFDSWFKDSKAYERQEKRSLIGCPQCGGTGYRGRLALHEVMLMSEELNNLVVSRASSEDLRRVATAQGMMELRADGLAKVALGVTLPTRAP